METNELHQLILDYSPFAVILTDEEGNILYLNKCVEEIFEYSTAELSGKKIETLIAFRMPEPHSPAGRLIPVDVLSKDIRRSQEFLGVKKDAEHIPVEVTHTVFNIRAVTYMSWGIRVISAEQKILHDLRERVKEQAAILGVTETLFGTEDVASALQQCTQHIRDGWQFPQQTHVRIKLEDAREFHTENFSLSSWHLSSVIPGVNESYGVLEVCYSEEAPISDQSVFLAEEKTLITGLARLLGLYLDHRKALTLLRESNEAIQKITQQIPANTFQFEMFDDAPPKIHFGSKGLLDNNHLDMDALIQDTGMISKLMHPEDVDRFYDALRTCHVAQSELSTCYRVVYNDVIAWRWIRAKPATLDDGRIMWYACAQDITPIIEYTDVLEQILFDISHVMRRPVSTILGLTDLLARQEGEIDEQMIRDFTKHFKVIATEMDECLKKLNVAYHERKVSTLPLKNFGVDVSSGN